MRVLNPTLLGTEAPPYEQVAADLGFESAHQAANALVTAKRTFTRALRSVVGEYAADEREISAELRELWTTLSVASPRRCPDGKRPSQ